MSSSHILKKKKVHLMRGASPHLQYWGSLGLSQEKLLLTQRGLTGHYSEDEEEARDVHEEIQGP